MCTTLVRLITQSALHKARNIPAPSRIQTSKPQPSGRYHTYSHQALGSCSQQAAGQIEQERGHAIAQNLVCKTFPLDSNIYKIFFNTHRTAKPWVQPPEWCACCIYYSHTISLCQSHNHIEWITNGRARPTASTIFFANILFCKPLW